MHRLRTYSGKLVLLIVALQIINLSVYSNAYNEYACNVHADRTIGYANKIDCLAEYVTEIVLHHSNAFPERNSEGRENNRGQSLKHADIKLVKMQDDGILIPAPQNFAITHASYLVRSYNLFYREINPPPPKTV